MKTLQDIDNEKLINRVNKFISELEIKFSIIPTTINIRYYQHIKKDFGKIYKADIFFNQNVKVK